MLLFRERCVGCSGPGPQEVGVYFFANLVSHLWRCCYRLCGIKCTSDDQLWRGISSSNTDVCDYDVVQRTAASHCHLRSYLFRRRICRLQIQTSLRYVLPFLPILRETSLYYVVFYKPYESRGQAWPITFIRLIWGVVIFLLFMTGIFTLRKSWILSSLLVPLLFGTIAWSWYIDKRLKPLSKYVSLSSVFEVQRGEETADVTKLRAGHPVTWSQRWDFVVVPFDMFCWSRSETVVIWIGGDTRRMTIHCMLHLKMNAQTMWAVFFVGGV